MTEEELPNWENICDEEGVGCFLRVGLKCSENLHDLFNDYPLASESLKLNGVKKLVPKLNDKRSYVVHFRNLKFYLEMGMELTEIHDEIIFRERLERVY